MDAHSLHSARREKILENLFIGEVLRELWCRDVYEADVLQSDIDASGYDVVLEVPSGVRHIQLKSSINDKSWRLSANGKISERPSGCLVKMIINSKTLEFEKFYWLGNPIGQSAPDISGGISQKNARSNQHGVKGIRKNTYKIKKSMCEPLNSISDVVDKLLERKS